MAKGTARTGLAVIAFAVVGVSFYGKLCDLIPGWLLGLGLAVGIILAAIASAILPARDRRRDEADALSPWRHLHAARIVSLVASASEECDLVLELVPDLELDGAPVELRFRGVRRLRLQQFDEYVVHFDYLICDEIPAKRDTPRLLHVRDRWDETLSFQCREFAVVAACQGSETGT